MSREQIMRWAERQGARSPRPGYCTGMARFGPNCFDCSGFTYMAYLASGLTIPADSSLVARWGRTNGQVHPVSQARYADLMVHDKYGDPYNSSGPRGHIGLFDHFTADGRVVCWESSGTGHGVNPVSRPAWFWAISVCHPVLAGVAPKPMPTPTPIPDLEDEMNRCYLLEDSRVREGGHAKRIAVGNLLEAKLLNTPADVDRYTAYLFDNAKPGDKPIERGADGKPLRLKVDPADMDAALSALTA